MLQTLLISSPAPRRSAGWDLFLGCGKVYLCGPSWDREITALISDFILLFCQLLTPAFSRSLSLHCAPAYFQPTRAIILDGEASLVFKSDPLVCSRCTIPQCPLFLSFFPFIFCLSLA